MYSYVTLVANADYVLGAIALARSLKRVGAQAPLTVMTTGDYEHLETLAALGCTLLPVEPLPLSEAFRSRHARESIHTQSPYLKGNKPAFHDPLLNFAKLRLWELDRFERVVFIDADALVIRSIDRLFGYPEFSAAPNVYESLADFHRLNSGVFVAQPNRNTFDSMLAALDTPDAYWRRTDQTFLETYFPEWHGLPYTDNTLQYVWFNLPQLWRWSSIRLIHYQYEKPWEPDHPKQDVLKPLIDVWWCVYETGRMPDRLPEPPQPTNQQAH